ncbi:hypothetical protein ACFQZZ_05540 [Nocardia sp. GCM10030253]|uniref:hypothetical protein n=1 Tax=Nocardia sp. GCM10030253 TaxID=3273404 RepID=UPI00363C3300
MIDTTALRDAYTALDNAAATVADSGSSPVPPTGEWNADQILAHVALVNGATIAAAASVASGENTTYDNRRALDTWTIERLTTLAGGNTGLRDRIRRQANVLCELSELLSDAELDTLVPALLLSNNTVLVDRPMPLREIITGLADAELPGHTQQLMDLLPARAEATA